MPNPLPKPPDSLIQEDESLGGIRYFWKPQNAAGSLARIVPILFMLAFAVAWSFGEYHAITALYHSHSFSGLNAFGTIFTLFWLGGWTFGGLFCFFILIILLLPDSPESVTLIDNTFEYQHGQMTLIVDPNAPPKPRIPLSKRKLKGSSIKLDKSDLTEFVYEEVDGELCLYVAHPNGRTQIGRYLQPADREWLYVVLEEWRTR